MPTSDEKIAVVIAGRLNQVRAELTAERDALLKAQARIAEIDDELAVIDGEHAKVASRLPMDVTKAEEIEVAVKP